MRIRSSMLGRAVICPGVLSLDAPGSGTAYTAVGQVGHRFIELMLTGDTGAAEATIADQPEEWKDQVWEFWGWLVESQLIPTEPSPNLRTEIPVEATLASDPSVQLTGTLDYLWSAQESDAAVVADWKFYNDPGMLPPIGRDLQMIAYGALALHMMPHVEHVVVYRFLAYFLRVEQLSLSRATTLALADQAIKEALDDIASRSGQFVTGAQCGTCLARQRCNAFAGLAGGVQSTEMTPYAGGDLESEDRALSLLLALPAVKARIEAAEDGLRRWVGKHGPIVDPSSGSTWGPGAITRSLVVDPMAALRRLGGVVGPTAALGAVKIGKGPMEAAMKAKKVPPDQRRALFDELRRSGAMVLNSIPTWAWSKKR